MKKVILAAAMAVISIALFGQGIKKVTYLETPTLGIQDINAASMVVHHLPVSTPIGVLKTVVMTATSGTNYFTFVGFDPNGRVLTSKRINVGGTSCHGSKIIATSDGGYAAIGWSNLVSTVQTSGVFIKLNSTLDIVNGLYIDNPVSAESTIKPVDIVEISKGYVIIGNMLSLMFRGFDDFFIMKLNKINNNSLIFFEQTGTYNNDAVAALEFTANSLLIAGRTGQGANGSDMGVLSKWDTSGNFILGNIFNIGVSNGINDIAMGHGCAPNTIYLAGEVQTTTDKNALLIKITTPRLNAAQYIEYGWRGDETITGIVYDSVSNYLTAVGSSTEWGAGDIIVSSINSGQCNDPLLIRKTVSFGEWLPDTAVNHGIQKHGNEITILGDNIDWTGGLTAAKKAAIVEYRENTPGGTCATAREVPMIGSQPMVISGWKPRAYPTLTPYIVRFGNTSPATAAVEVQCESPVVVQNKISSKTSPVTDVYDMTGRRVSARIENLPAGIYLVKYRDGSVKKVFSNN